MVVEVTRNAFVESTHAIDVVIADASGSIHCTYGDQKKLIYPRSAIKSLQALPLVESGASEAFGLEDKHLALACSSHNGEAMHVECAAEILDRAGLTPQCLQCGAQMPMLMADQRSLIGEPSHIHNTCSGKHAGFLAFAAHAGLETKDYISLQHPVQREIASVLENITDHPHGQDNHGIDGCSIPTYSIPLEKLAIAYAKFGVGYDPNPARSKAMLHIRDACFAHPEMIAGKKRNCTRLMQALLGRAFVKYGAEGVYTASLPELGLGIALKARDGASRSVDVAISYLCAQLLELNDEETTAMAPLLRPKLKNRNQIEIGQMQVAG